MTEETPTAAFILSLIGGIIILLSGIAVAAFGSVFMYNMADGYYPGMMYGFRGLGYFSLLMLAVGIIGVILGIIIVVGAYFLHTRPAEHGTWGIVILVLSVISFIGGGGFLIGAILGIIGGILAIVWKPPEKPQEHAPQKPPETPPETPAQ